LGERLASARAEVDAAKASVTSATKEASRLKSLNANDQNVSDKAVEEAEAQLAAQQARLKSAQASVKLLAAPLQVDSGVGPGPLQVRKSGQITEIAAQPGETVQAGQPLLRVSRFDHLLARLHVPPGQSVPASPSRATIYLADNPDVALAAHRVALAGSIDPKYPGQTWLFRLAPGKAPLRPGQAVTAHIPVTGQRVTGVSIPSSAILRYEGETWVYVERAAGEFVRRVAHLEEPGKEGWIARSGFAPGERIVIAGAQSLLSEQLRYQLESDEE
jgi:RND family efflux transporter MFP subunit